MQSNAAHYWNPNAAIIADAFEFIDKARVTLKVQGISPAYVETYKPRAYDYYRMALRANKYRLADGDCDAVAAFDISGKLVMALDAVERLEEAIRADAHR